MWPFRKLGVKMCDCGTDFCFEPGHIQSLSRARPGVIITPIAPPYETLREENERLRAALKWLRVDLDLIDCDLAGVERRLRK